MNGKNPRQIALRVLQARAGGDYTETLLERALDPVNIRPNDRALCQELAYGAVRWQATLDWLIARKTEGRKQNAGIQSLLRLGLYQIFWLDRIPPHAAAHETVELAKTEGFGPKSGFINAILRGYLREFETTKDLLVALKTSDPALGSSHPQWLFEIWQKRFGQEPSSQLAKWNNIPPKTFARANTMKTDAGKLIETWRAEGVEYDFVRRDFLSENTAFELKSHPPLASLESFRNGWFYVQDPGTLLAPLELAPKAGETILDLCAAPGGKTAFIAQLMDNTGRIVACDVSEERLQLIRENCQRLGITCVETLPNSKLAALNVKFDKVLIDAPCSNTGVLRRRVDLRWRVTADEIARLQKAQLDLLHFAADQLKPGGVLVYSTCSLEPEENTDVIREFISSHPNFKMERQRELLPFADQVDGAYVSCLVCA